MIKHFALTLIASLCCAAAQAQAQSPAPSPFPTDFPVGAQTPDAKALAERLGGQVFTVKTANGLGWRLDIKTSGHIFVDISNGARDNGPWRTEDGKICVEYRGRLPSGCNEVRLLSAHLLPQTRAGEIVTLVPQ